MLEKKYTSLVSNTVIFAMGSLLVKLISLFLMPLYTSVLTTSEYGISELLNNANEIVLPIATLGIVEALFRFSIDEDADYNSLFVNTLFILFIGNVVCGCICAFMYLVCHYQYAILFFFLYFSASFYKVVTQFARGLGHVKRFALYGVINSFLLVLSSAYLLVILHGGTEAYLLSYILAYFAAGILAFVFSKEFIYLKNPYLNKGLLKEMLKYSLPMIPNSLSWWANNVASRYIVLALCGAAAAGLYTAASKLPAMINIITSVFQQAWQYSTAQEIDSEDRNSFFYNIFRCYSFVCIMGTLVLLILNKPICFLLLHDTFYEAWRCVPLLLYAASLGCISTFFGTFYQALKSNKGLMLTTIVGAAVNLSLCCILIPLFSIYGAAFSMIAGYLIITIMRIVDMRKKMSFHIDVAPLSVQFLILAGYTCITSYFDASWIYIIGLIILILFFWKDRKLVKLLIKIGLNRQV